MTVPPPASLHVLLVEDRAVDAELVERELRRAGIACRTRRILEPGLAYLQEPFRPDAFAQKVREVLNRHT